MMAIKSCKSLLTALALVCLSHGVLANPWLITTDQTEWCHFTPELMTPIILPATLERDRQTTAPETGKRAALLASYNELKDSCEKQIEAMEAELAAIQKRLQALNDRQTQLQQELSAAQDDGSTLQSWADYVKSAWGNELAQRRSTLREQLKTLEAEIQDLAGQAAHIAEALKAKQQECARRLAPLHLELLKSDAAALATEQREREDDLRALNIRYYTQAAQMAVAEAAFTEQLERLQTLEKSLRDDGLADAADHLASTEIKDLRDAREQWRQAARTVLLSLWQDLFAAYDANQADGIGPTNRDELEQALSEREQKEGVAVGTYAIEPDAELVDLAGRNARNYAEGQPLNTRFFSIFDGINSESLLGLSQDYLGTLHEYYEDPGLFARRLFLDYGGGVVHAGLDGLVGIGELLVEAIDTTGEITEGAINCIAGTDLQYFGRENLLFLDNFATTSIAAFDFRNPAEQQAAIDTFYGFGYNIYVFADRRLSAQAAAGDVGAFLGDTGFVTGSVLGVEELAIQGVAHACHVVRGARLAGITTDAGRVAGAATDATGASRVAGTVTEAAGAVIGPSVNLPPPIRSSLTVRLETAVDGSIVAVRSDGGVLYLRPTQELGSGSSSTAYRLFDSNGVERTDMILKVTVDGPERHLDAFGAEVIRKLDPTGNHIQVTNEYGRLGVAEDLSTAARFDGGEMILVERFQDFKGATGGAQMSAGQLAAREQGLRVLNDAGYVMMDIKTDNFGFVKKLGTEDEWIIKFMDSGGIIPVKGGNAADAARLQRALDNPPTEILEAWRAGTPVNGMDARRAFMAHLAGEFDDIIDWERLAAVTGGEDFRSLGVGQIPFIFPYNPKAALDDPALIGRVASPAPAVAVAPATASRPPLTAASADVVRSPNYWRRAMAAIGQSLDAGDSPLPDTSTAVSSSDEDASQPPAQEEPRPGEIRVAVSETGDAPDSSVRLASETGTPTPAYVNIKATSSAVSAGKAADNIPGMQIKLVFPDVADPPLPGSDVAGRDTDTGADQEPAQAVTDDEGNAQIPVFPIPGATPPAGNIVVEIESDPTATSVIAPLGTPVGQLSEPDKQVKVGNDIFLVYYLPEADAINLVSGPIETNICLIKEPVGPGTYELAPPLPAAPLPGARLALGDFPGVRP